MAQKTMTKLQLLAAVAEASGLDKGSAGRAIDALVDVVTREVAAGGAVAVPGLGKFSCRDRAERSVRNPATGEAIVKPADRAVKVSVAKALKDVVNA